jgi:hypothetical protein
LVGSAKEVRKRREGDGSCRLSSTDASGGRADKRLSLIDAPHGPTEAHPTKRVDRTDLTGDPVRNKVRESKPPGSCPIGANETERVRTRRRRQLAPLAAGCRLPRAPQAGCASSGKLRFPTAQTVRRAAREATWRPRSGRQVAYNVGCAGTLPATPTCACRGELLDSLTCACQGDVLLAVHSRHALAQGTRCCRGSLGHSVEPEASLAVVHLHGHVRSQRSMMPARSFPACGAGVFRVPRRCGSGRGRIKRPEAGGPSRPRWPSGGPRLLVAPQLRSGLRRAAMLSSPFRRRSRNENRRWGD